MEKIRAYTGYKPGRHLYNIFDVVNELPKVGEESPFSFSEIVTSIKSVDLDCEQGDPEVWDYDYYRMESVPKPTELDEDDDPEDYKRVKYICIEKEDVDEEYDRFIDHLLDKGFKIYEKNQEFDFVETFRGEQYLCSCEESVLLVCDSNGYLVATCEME